MIECKLYCGVWKEAAQIILRIIQCRSCVYQKLVVPLQRRYGQEWCYRLVVQDNGLSRRKLGFESR